ncbi:MAG: hypothetical protein KDA44_10110 [Planctomycetales bacterium]|nr:hypothetical protein [Planctomycetales bacterium]
MNSDGGFVTTKDTENLQRPRVFNRFKNTENSPQRKGAGSDACGMLASNPQLALRAMGLAELSASDFNLSP